MKYNPRTRLFIVLSLLSFLWLCLVSGAYEVWTLLNNVPNDTISHQVAIATVQYPWIPSAFIGFGGVFVAFWLTCAFHWWGRGFWWKPAVFVTEKVKEKAE